MLSSVKSKNSLTSDVAPKKLWGKVWKLGSVLGKTPYRLADLDFEHSFAIKNTLDLANKL